MDVWQSREGAKHGVPFGFIKTMKIGTLTEKKTHPHSVSARNPAPQLRIHGKLLIVCWLQGNHPKPGILNVGAIWNRSIRSTTEHVRVCGCVFRICSALLRNQTHSIFPKLALRGAAGSRRVVLGPADVVLRVLVQVFGIHGVGIHHEDVHREPMQEVLVPL